MDSNHDISALKSHAFFEGIDFNTDLTELNIKELLEETAPEEAEEPKARVSVTIDRESSEGARAAIVQFYGPLKPDQPILVG